MLAVVKTRAKVGVSAQEVLVEAHISNGLPALAIVGLPEATVKESRDRVRSAIINSGFEFPARRITINLAPADLPKEGGRYDLPIALGILAASGQVAMDKFEHHEFLGELALSGELRPVLGALPAAMACSLSSRVLVLPQANGRDAALVNDAEVLTATSLLEACSFLNGSKTLPHCLAPEESAPAAGSNSPDLAEVRGQSTAKRALTIAAAGSHNLLFYGSPGTGKTMLASRLPGILPPLTDNEALEVAAVQSLTRHNYQAQWKQRPFRAPHHTASAAALVGGGSEPRPGEISLAHHGVLFLDELPEFDRRVLEVLREPLESGEITVSRVRGQVNFPSKFQLVAAMNPCACGYLGDRQRACSCRPDQVARYRNKISGPLLDRIDMHVEVNSLPAEALLAQQQISGEQSSHDVQQMVIKARQQQLDRQQKSNAQLSSKELDQVCQLTQEQRSLLSRAMEQLGLSARATHRILRLARTIADLTATTHIETAHLKEAIGYRKLDRKPGNNIP